MLLKKKYNLKNLIKKKRFLPLNPSLLTYSSIFSLYFKRVKNQKEKVYNLNKKSNFDLNKNQKSKTKVLKIFNSVFNKNKNLFFEKNKYYKYKQLDTYFQDIIKDQKKRTLFAKNELNKSIFKGLLSVNKKTFLFTQRMLFNNLKIFAFKPLPFKIKAKKQKTKFKNQLQKTLKTRAIFQLSTSNIYQQMKVNRNSNAQYARLGPILFLEKRINALFTTKRNSLSRIRNRCLLILGLYQGLLKIENKKIFYHIL